MSDVGGLAADPGLGGLPPVEGARPYVLTINGGSSSLKFAVFAGAGPANRSSPAESSGSVAGNPGWSSAAAAAAGGSIARSRPRTRLRPPCW